MKKTPFYDEETAPWRYPRSTTEEGSAVAYADTGRHLWDGVDRSEETKRLDEECAMAIAVSKIQGDDDE